MGVGMFLSYGRSDIEKAQQVQALLEEKGLTVWIDQEDIYTGNNWPKAIGEGIAGQAVFMLLWSRHAAASHFVEFEWNTALALKKMVIPVLLDRTPLPLSLQAVQAIDYDALPASVDYMRELIQKAAAHHVKPRKEVLNRLNELQAQSSPEKVVADAKAIYRQEGWAVQGNVYQVHGENINFHAPSNSTPAAKKWYESWQAYITLTAGILGIVAILLELPKKWREAIESPTGEIVPNSATTSTAKAEEVVETISLKGTVLTEDNQPLRGAIVKLDKLPGDSTVTTSDGGFIFEKVPGQVGENVRVYVYAPGYESRDEYKALPGPATLRLVKVEKTR